MLRARASSSIVDQADSGDARCTGPEIARLLLDSYVCKVVQHVVSTRPLLHVLEVIRGGVMLRSTASRYVTSRVANLFRRDIC
jgi:hypothetical protein